MPQFKEDFSGKVEAVLITEGLTSSISQRVRKIQLFPGYGIKGDRHSGRRLVDVREKDLLGFGVNKGSEMANIREVTLVSKEELDVIAQKMQLSGEIPPGYLGENLIISGIENFSELPAGTVLYFQKPKNIRRTATIYITGENSPCEIPAQAIGTLYPEISDVVRRFTDAAHNRRGLTGFVLTSGTIHEGDSVLGKMQSRSRTTR